MARRHFQKTEPIADRLATFAKLMRERAKTLPPGLERSEALEKARDAEATIEMEKWVSAAELRSQE